MNNTTADASFVQSNGNCGRTSVLVTGDKIISVSNTALPTGVTVVKYGVTTGLTVGSIIYTSYNQHDNPIWVNNQMVASFSNAPGDSGGPVMFYNGMSGSQVLYKLVGIIAGGNGTY